MTAASSKILFIINPGSGKNNIDWKQEIETFFKGQHFETEIIELPNPCKPEVLREQVKKSGASKVIAVGGDGTVKLVADILRNSTIQLGILPAGSANGMAKELSIAADPVDALQTLIDGEIHKIHLININNEICVHLSDVGFNAFVVKKFEDENTRGMWGYIKAAWKVLWSHSRMTVSLKIGEETIRREAVMVVIANGSMYGNGVVINPQGSLYDKLFEVVIIKRISLMEIIKMRFFHNDFHPDKTELFQTQSLLIKSKRKMHFQIDGEYKGKVNAVNAEILVDSLDVIVPRNLVTQNDVVL